MGVLAGYRPTGEAWDKAQEILKLLSGETIETADQALHFAQKQLSMFREISEKQTRFTHGMVTEFLDAAAAQVLQEPSTVHRDDT